MARPVGQSGAFRGGFTIIELLVVILAILLLLAILVPAANKAYEVVERSIAMSQIHMIGGGVEMYRNDFNAYPPSAGGGGANLVRLLTGKGFTTPNVPANQQPDWGFRLYPRGRIYGPYNGTEGLPMTSGLFTDRWDNPILYYRYDPTAGTYNSGDNSGGPVNVNTYVGGRRRDYVLMAKGYDGQWQTVAGAPQDDVTNLQED